MNEYFLRSSTNFYFKCVTSGNISGTAKGARGARDPYKTS